MRRGGAAVSDVLARGTAGAVPPRRGSGGPNSPVDLGGWFASGIRPSVVDDDDDGTELATTLLPATRRRSTAREAIERSVSAT
ncbi:MAG: hypothetical protein U0168_05935 [Nannocystaceae bacterium]